VFEGVHIAKRFTDEFPEKSWTKRGVNNLLIKLRDRGAVDRWPGSGGPRSARNEEKIETTVSSQENKPQTHRIVCEISRETSVHRCTQNAVFLHFLPYLVNINRKFDILISQGSVATCLR